MKVRMLTCTVRHVRRTRSREQINENDRKIKVFWDEMNTACKALITLGMYESEIEVSGEIADVDLDCMEDLEGTQRERRHWGRLPKTVMGIGWCRKGSRCINWDV